MFTPRVSLNIKSNHLLFAIGFLLFLVSQLLIALPARADCTYEGRRYKTGDVRGPYVCMPDGSWQPR
jgi:hypothetical protein